MAAHQEKQPFSASDIDKVKSLLDRLANDKTFADEFRAHKPGEEDKLKRFLEKHHFSDFAVQPVQPPQGEKQCYEVCLCSTIIKGLCVCVRYCFGS
jgi:hypothetical protein